MSETSDTWIIADGVEGFGDTAVPHLTLEPAANTLLLTVFERLRAHGPHAFGDADPQFALWHGPDGRPGGALLRTPPFGYVLSHIPAEAARALVDLLLDPAKGLDGRQINLPDTVVEPFTAAWIARTGRTPRIGERNRLYRLEEFIPPDPAPAGRVRRADLLDVPLVARFVEEFWTEVQDPPPAGVQAEPRRVARARIEEGAFWLWCDETDRPVSLAGHAPIVAGAGRIGPVYTPKDARGRGYAGAVTATVARVLREAGAQEVLLFTDLANPTSNALYQRIGFRPVSDRIRLELDE
ncbi:GNAT family N-acetyltransferase [Actinospica durhamensis]|uniref:GNAT family N-acetyltransferase n=1 Tax=Actinospica durhamensis TaxID=1508375 RepID=A0A941EPQ0_9ACTN|nr:GNAT family N-acetyltransferase [Actinospica durhamensis]MBR7836240.1 GNAT family N-acetyltransferase [Actinospica durhamensis]